MTTARATVGPGRLAQLYEMNKLFNAFTTVDDTVGKALQVVAATLPLESALLLQAALTSRTELTVWRCKDSTPASVRVARDHAEALYAYFVGAQTIESLDLHVRVGSTKLPALRDRRAPSKHQRRFVMIPLVVTRGVVFGALQLEAASGLDRDDVEFISTLTNQLAIALDRERTRRHDVLRRREAQLLHARYENIVDGLDAAFVWEADLETHRISYVSAEFERLLGFSRRECLDEYHWWRSHGHPDDRAHLEQAFARALAERGSQRCEHRVIASDQAVMWLHTSMKLTDAPGEAPRFRGLSYDITAARTAQRRMQEQVALAGAVMSHLNEGALAVDLDGRITFINGAGASLLGCSRAQALGKIAADLARVVDRNGELLASPLETAMRSGTVVRSDDHRIVRSNGSRLRASYSAAAIRDNGDLTGALLVFHEITEGHAAQSGERLLLGPGTPGDSLECPDGASTSGAPQLDDATPVDGEASDDQPDRLAIAAHKQALAIVSHELKAPLTTIAIALEAIDEDALTGPGTDRPLAVEMIRRATARMARLIDDLVDFTSMKSGRCTIVASPEDTSEIIRESTASFEPIAAARGVRLVADESFDMPLIQCDRDRVLQVIANLLSNALKVVNRGGSVHLAVKQRENEVVFSVADTGPGIAVAEHAHLFEAYWRSPRASYSGLGLGLAIARGIVEGHGGRIWADSELGRGATFFFTIPLAGSHPPP